MCLYIELSIRNLRDYNILNIFLFERGRGDYFTTSGYSIKTLKRNSAHNMCAVSTAVLSTTNNYQTWCRLTKGCTKFDNYFLC